MKIRMLSVLLLSVSLFFAACTSDSASLNSRPAQNSSSLSSFAGSDGQVSSEESAVSESSSETVTSEPASSSKSQPQSKASTQKKLTPNKSSNQSEKDDSSYEKSVSSKSASSSAASKPDTTSQPSSSAGFEAEVVRLTNAERANAGLPLLQSDDAALNKAAEKRAQEIVISFSHTRPDGTSPFTVLGEFDVQFTAAGENIAYGQTSPAQVVDGWMNSEGHRANILNGIYTGIGVGHVESNGIHYWVQLFVKK